MRPRYKIVATCYDKEGRVVSRSINNYDKTHPAQAHFAKMVGLPSKMFLHAEIAALLKCKMPPYRLVVERYYKNGKPAPAKPCKVCQKAIEHFNVKVLEHT